MHCLSVCGLRIVCLKHLHSAILADISWACAAERTCYCWHRASETQGRESGDWVHRSI